MVARTLRIMAQLFHEKEKISQAEAILVQLRKIVRTKRLSRKIRGEEASLEKLGR